MILPFPLPTTAIRALPLAPDSPWLRQGRIEGSWPAAWSAYLSSQEPPTSSQCGQELARIPQNTLSVLAQVRGLKTVLVIPERQVPRPGGTRPSQNRVWTHEETENGLVSIAARLWPVVSSRAASDTQASGLTTAPLATTMAHTAH